MERNLNKNISLVATLVALLTGIVVAIGWLIHSDLLISIFPGDAKLKFNAALCFIFSSIVLLLYNFPVENKSRLPVSDFLCLLVFLIGALTLLEYIFHIDLGVDQLIVRDRTPATTDYFPGRISPLAAMNFVLISISLFLLNKGKATRYHVFSMAVVAFVSLLMLIVFNFITDIPVYWRMAIPAALGFIILSVAIYFAIPAIRQKISLGWVLMTGFIAAILILGVISALTFYYTDKGARLYKLVEQTDDILRETEKALSLVKDIEGGGRGYVITGDSTYLDQYGIAKKIISGQITQLRKFAGDNHSLILNIDSLEPLVKKRIGFSDQCIRLRNKNGFNAANNFMSTGQGLLYSNRIRAIITRIQEEENIKKQSRQEANDRSALAFNQAFSTLLGSILIVLGIIFFILRSNFVRRRKAEIQIRESENQIQAIFNGAPDAVIVIDDKGNIVKWNSKSESLFGRNEDEVTGMPLSEIIIPHRYREAHAAGMKHFLRTGEGPVLNRSIELQALKKDNSEFDVAVSISPIRVHNKYLFIGFIRDITEQKRTEDQISASNKRFTTVFNISPVAITINDSSRRFLYVNDAFCEMSGYVRENLIGKTSTELNHVTIEEQEKRVNAVNEGGGKAKGIELTMKRANGQRIHVINSIEKIEIDNEPCWVSTIIDITGRKVAEAQIQKQRQEIQDFIDSMSTLCAKVSTEGRLLLVNKTALQATGLTMEELLNTNFIEGYWWAFDPEVHARVAAAFKKACLGNTVNYDENIFAFGQVLTINFSLIPILKPDGSVDYIVAEGNDISQKKKIEEEIRQLNAELEHRVEERTIELQKSLREVSDYKYAIDESSILAITDQKGIIRHANDNFCRISKYSREELIGQDHRIINSGHHSKEFIRNLWGTIARGKIWKGELKNRAKDGAIYWVDTTIVPFLNEEGKPYQYVAIRADITERKQAEQSLFESQQLLSAIIDNSTAVIYVKNLEGRYLLFNRRFAELFHLEPDSIIGKTDHDIFAKADADAFREMDVRTALSGEAVRAEEKVPQDDGIHTYISVKSRLYDDTGKPYAIFGISTDITELKIVEENLRKSLREIADYKFALDESSIVAITDQKGIIRHVNNNFCKISKYRADELIGQDHRIINSGYHPKSYIRDLWVTIANGNIWRGELKNRAKDQSIYWVDTTIIPFLNQEGKPYQYVAIRTDITGRKKAENELQELNEELEQKVIERTAQFETVNKELEAFSYSVSHDLRAPLRGIVGFTAMLEENYTRQLDDEAKRIMAIIRRNTLKMGRLIDDLLAFSRMGKQELVKTKIDTNVLVREIVDDLIQQHKDPDRITWEIHSLPPVKADLNTIRQVWINFIANAIKYSRNNQSPRIEIGSYLNEGQIVYYIKDNGAGFNEQYKHKLFKVFQRLHNVEEFEGTGVGLAIVHKIISRHGGKVWAEAKEGQGASFYFSLSG